MVVIFIETANFTLAFLALKCDKLVIYEVNEIDVKQNSFIAELC